MKAQSVITGVPLLFFYLCVCVYIYIYRMYVYIYIYVCIYIYKEDVPIKHNHNIRHLLILKEALISCHPFPTAIDTYSVCQVVHHTFKGHHLSSLLLATSCAVIT